MDFLTGHLLCILSTYMPPFCLHEEMPLNLFLFSRKQVRLKEVQYLLAYVTQFVSVGTGLKPQASRVQWWGPELLQVQPLIKELQAISSICLELHKCLIVFAQC